MSGGARPLPVRPQHLELLAVLLQHRVEFVLVGGVALQFHGAAHTTLDVDVVVAVDADNHSRIDAALLAVDARPIATSERGTKFMTRLGELELLNTTSGVGAYEGWLAAAEQVALVGGLRVQLAARVDIERNKRAAGRDKDTAHLVLLASPGRDPRSSVVQQLLGPRPEQPAPARRWDGVADMVERYRERYAVSDDEPLGAQPADAEQRRDRERVQRLADSVCRAARDTR